MKNLTNRDKAILFPVLFIIFFYIVWFGPDSFQTTLEVLK